MVTLKEKDGEQTTDFFNCETKEYTFSNKNELMNVKQNNIQIEQYDDSTQPYQMLDLDCLCQPNFNTIDMNLFQYQKSNSYIKHHVRNKDFESSSFEILKEYLADSGQGGFSKIDIVQDYNNVKLVRKKVFHLNAFQNELRLFQNNRNKYIVQIYYYSLFKKEFYLEKGDYTVQSLYKHELIKDEFFTFVLCMTIVEAVNSLHFNNIFHGDIKPANIILIQKEGFSLDNIIKNNNSQRISDLKEDFQQLYQQLYSEKNHMDKSYPSYQSFIYQILFKIKKNRQFGYQYYSYTQILEEEYKLSLKFIDFQSSFQLNTIQTIRYFTQAFTHKNLLNKIQNNQNHINKQSNISTINNNNNTITNNQSTKTLNPIQNHNNSQINSNINNYDNLSTINQGLNNDSKYSNTIIDMILLDKYSCLRSLILIAINFSVNKKFLEFQDKECIEDVKNNYLKEYLLSFLSLYDSVDDCNYSELKKQEIQQLQNFIEPQKLNNNRNINSMNDNTQENINVNNNFRNLDTGLIEPPLDII